jgi:hypothetical protein
MEMKGKEGRERREGRRVEGEMESWLTADNDRNTRILNNDFAMALVYYCPPLQ